MTCINFGTIVLLALGTALFGQSGASAAERPPFSLADVARLREISSPLIAPDGSAIAYIVNHADIVHDRRGSILRIFDTITRSDVRVSGPEELVSSPVWSPSGELAFVASISGKPTIIILDQGRRERTRIVLQEAPRALIWSPDGRQLAFLAAQRVSRPADLPFAPPPGSSWVKPGRVIDSPEFQKPDQPLVDPIVVNLYLVEATGDDRPRQVNQAPLGRTFPFFGNGLSWSLDGKSIYLSADLGEFWRDLFRSKLYSIDIDSGALAPIGIGEYQYTPKLSADGRLLAYQCMSKGPGTYFRRQICIRDLRERLDRVLLPDFDRDISGIVWAPDGRSLIVTYADHGYTKISRITLSSENQPTLLARTSRPTSISVARNGTIAFIDADDLTPGELAVLMYEKVTRLTSVNTQLLSERKIGRTQSVIFKASDSAREVEGFLTLPPDGLGAKPYPTFVFLHGGQSSADGPAFRAYTQVFAAHGYAVLAVNYRGSGSYGSELGNTIVYPKGSELDVLGGVEELISRGISDPDRLFIGGGSGGGATTAWTIAHSDRFKAAAMWYPPVNWQDGQYEAATGFTTQKHQWGAMPWEKPFEYAALSPITYVGRVNTPTLLVVGDRDRITPASGAIAYFNALRFRKVPSRLVLVPDEPHGTDVYPSHVLGLLANTIEWFARFGGPKLNAPTWDVTDETVSAASSSVPARSTEHGHD